MVIGYVIYALCVGFALGYCASVWQEKSKLDKAYDDGYDEGSKVGRRKMRDIERYADQLAWDNAWLRSQRQNDEIMREGVVQLEQPQSKTNT